MLIPNEFIQRVIEHTDIVATIGRSVSLKQRGGNWLGLCPFHNEKTPSFSVNPGRQFYYCFGCGAHGSVLGFLMEQQGLTFLEAVQELAHRAGWSLPATTAQNTRSVTLSRETMAAQEMVHHILEEVLVFYQRTLQEHSVAKAYLEKRQVGAEVAKKFELGYAPSAKNHLRGILGERYEGTVAEQSGLLGRSEGGKLYDRFRDRLMFPIRNARGQLVGFGGRIIGEGEPKYLNSPETILFHKGQEVYGLPQAKNAIRQERNILVVEGYMDVIALAEHGVGEAVATLGTACSVEQIRRLLRLSDHITFCFDGDQAGQRAAFKAYENSLEIVGDKHWIGFMFLPGEDDPDSYIRRRGASSFRQLMRDAEPLSRFLLRHAQKDDAERDLNLDTIEGRMRMLRRAQPWLKMMSSNDNARGLFNGITTSLANLASMPLTEVLSILEIKPRFKLSVLGKSPDKTERSSVNSLEQQLLRILLNHPDLVHKEVVQEARGYIAENQLVSVLITILTEQEGLSIGQLLELEALKTHPQVNEMHQTLQLIVPSSLTQDKLPRSESDMEINSVDRENTDIDEPETRCYEICEQLERKWIKATLDSMKGDDILGDPVRYKSLLKRREELRKNQIERTQQNDKQNNLAVIH